MHSGLIRKLAHDRERNRLVSVADDKTLRLWQLPEIRPIATYRVPTNPGNEGQLFAVAVARDGASIATGGWTGWDWEKRGTVYLLDAATGAIKRRLSGFPNVIASLAFSPDGRHLAVGLQGKSGLFVLQLPDFKVIARDATYADKVLEMDFDRTTGRLAVSSLDGLIRVYSSAFKLLARKRVAPGAKPAGLRFSPDGLRLAIGFHDAPKLALVAAADLTLLSGPDTSLLPGQMNLPAVVWTPDGQRLCAGGDYRGVGQNRLYCWLNGGRGELRQMSLTHQRLADLETLASGDVVFAAEDPAIGIIGVDGKTRALRGPDVADFTGSSALRVNGDASLIAFQLAPGRTQTFHFSVDEHTRQPDASRLAQLRPAVLSAPAFAVQNWKDDYHPRVNGRALELENYEMSRCYAIAHDGQALLLGTEWALRLYDRDLNLKWMVPLTAVVRAVNVSVDGAIAVAALSDGTIRWFRTRDGVEILALFVHAQSEDWICWIPQGYYMSSALGDNFIGWLRNRDRETAPDFYRAVQFERLLYRPDLVLRHFRARGVVDASTARAPARRFDIADLASIAPPRVSIQVLKIDEAVKPASVKLRVAGRKTHLPLRDYTVFVNHIPVTPARVRQLTGSEAEAFTREIELELTAAENEVRLEVFNGASMGIGETTLTLKESYRTSDPRGDLYVLAVGVNALENLPKKYTLRFAARDAAQIVERFKLSSAGLYRTVHTRLVADETATQPLRAEVLAALDFVKDAGPYDTVVVFLAAHGISDAAGNYYFVPRDAQWTDVRQLLKGQAPKGASLISWTTFFDALRSAAGRRLLIVDTCQAKNIDGTFDAHALAKRSAASQFSLMVAARGEEESQEYAPAQHGLFTYAILSGLKGAADADGDGIVRLHELAEYATATVAHLRDPLLGPQTPQLLAPSYLRDTSLSRATRAE
jgi:WD40 repeat protein